MTERRQLRHARPLAGAAAVGLAGSWALAVRRPIAGWELDLTSTVNDVPDAVATGLYPVMQLGTITAPLVIALVIVVWRRDLPLALAAVGAGLAAWFGAKAIKQIVDRPRPLALLPEIAVRDGDGTGLGYLSGHSAVAAASAVVAAVALPRRARPLAAILAATVGVARAVHGVHLPVDLVGGWSFGILVGLGAVELADRISPPSRASLPAPPTAPTSPSP